MKTKYLWDGRYEYDICLFGSATDWREMFTKEYKKEGITFFNPLKRDWDEKDIKNETAHLESLRSRVIIFVITNETYSFRSFKEIKQLIRNFKQKRIFRYMLFYIDRNLLDKLENKIFLYLWSKYLRIKTIKNLKRLSNKPWGKSIILFDDINELLEFSQIFYKLLVPLINSLNNTQAG